jgi:1,4-dihydroxy-6-naphthoate synthase
MVKHRLGYSPCPNDTYIFYAWSQGLVGAEVPVTSLLYDVEELNGWVLEAKLEFTKASLAAFLWASDRYVALRSGGALGKGVGPLVLARRPLEAFEGLKVASPGRLTTAHLLFQLRYGQSCDLIPLRYDKIMPAIVSGAVDAGIIIHESRFTYEEYGLRMVSDLGVWWEGETGHPLPLGLILARRDLDSETIAKAQDATLESLLYARAHLQEVLPYMKANAQELDEEVIRAHVDLYVNNFTRDVGAEGEAAVRELFNRGVEMGLNFPAKGVFEPTELFVRRPSEIPVGGGGGIEWT